MHTMTISADIGADGRLKIDVLTRLPAGTHEVVLVIDDPPASGPNGAKIADLVGKLKWRGDAVAEQRRIRDEW